MSTRTTDPLLLAGRVLTYLMQGFMAIAALALIIALPVILFMQDKINAELMQEHGNTIGDFPALSVAGLLVIGLAIVGLIFFFFARLRRIIETVGDGDPFVPENADRLTSMAWMLLIVQALLLPAAALGILVATWAQQIEGVEFTMDGGLDLTGIIMVVVLFILARVFRKGTEMRDDLEGTV